MFRSQWFRGYTKFWNLFLVTQFINTNRLHRLLLPVHRWPPGTCTIWPATATRSVRCWTWLQNCPMNRAGCCCCVVCWMKMCTFYTRRTWLRRSWRWANRTSCRFTQWAPCHKEVRHVGSTFGGDGAELSADLFVKRDYISLTINLADLWLVLRIKLLKIYAHMRITWIFSCVRLSIRGQKNLCLSGILYALRIKKDWLFLGNILKVIWS